MPLQKVKSRREPHTGVCGKVSRRTSLAKARDERSQKIRVIHKKKKKKKKGPSSSQNFLASASKNNLNGDTPEQLQDPGGCVVVLGFPGCTNRARPRSGDLSHQHRPSVDPASAKIGRFRQKKE